MAKTLIGNVKGKDGRGIASISKTGTTGSVDTYTIKYTDNTTSTYTVNNSDSVSLQRQIVPSAAVESSATASQAYAAGDYVVVNGVLRKVKSAIAKGGAISDSNSTATTVTGELATLEDSVSQVKASVSGKQVRLGNSLICYIEGGVCIVSVDFLAVPVANSTCRIGTLPNGIKPLGRANSGQTGSDEVAYIAPLRYRGSDSMYGQLMVLNSGGINVYANQGGSGSSYYYGQLVFPVTRS